MTVIDTEEYRLAFGQYLRKGTPIRLSAMNDRPTPNMSGARGATRGSAGTHAANDGRLFSWNDSPGHRPSHLLLREPDYRR